MVYGISRNILKLPDFLAAVENTCRRFISAFSAAFAAADSYSQSRENESTNEKAVRFLNDYGESILRMAYSYLHNYADAEEIVQDTIVKVMKANPEFESSSHEKSYLLSTAANLSKNRIKFNKVRETDELSDDLAAEEREDLMFVWENVKQLPEKYSEVIYLFYHEGYKTSEIAAILGKNETTVRSNLSRARAMLKDSLKEAYDFE